MSAHQINICIYAFTEGPDDPRLTATLIPQLTTVPLHFRALGDLFEHLKSPATTDDIVVLWPADTGELEQLLSHERLQDRRLVVILPDAEEATLSLAHLLAPRFLCIADEVETRLAAVLNKMVANPPLKLASEGAAG